MFQDVAKALLKIFGTKVLYFMLLYEFTKNECFLLSFIGVTEILSVGLSDQYNSFLYRIFHIFNGCRVIVVKARIFVCRF